MPFLFEKIRLHLIMRQCNFIETLKSWRFLIIRLSLSGVSSGNIGIDSCELLLFKNDIGKYGLLQILRFQKLGLDFNT